VSASPGAAASRTPDPAAARARDAERLLTASSLADVINVQAKVAQDELEALSEQLAQVTTEEIAIVAELAALQGASDARRSSRERLLRDALRLAVPDTTTPANLSSLERDALEELQALDRGLRDRRAQLAERGERLADISEAVAAKQAHLQRLAGRSRYLATAPVRDESAGAAQAAVLAALAREASVVQVQLAQLVASATSPAASGSLAWSLPLRGPITQPFGPSVLALEPALSYRGGFYSHFHDAIDIAAPLGAPVTAAADGRVTFVGHLPDGAEVVSIYAHLDDTFMRPTVRVGQSVTRGQVIGYVGLTGLTTGPHLHFGVRKAGDPVDPLSVIAAG
jgi:murein DD-endopeptidase MepM/ murein hydrolase activator NlpD